MATPTADMVARLRRMTAEPITSDTYTQAEMSEVIARYPVVDADGLDPDDTLWAGAWDINQAAADVWEEKASLLATDFDFTADGGNYSRSQAYAQMLGLAKFYRSRRQTTTLMLKASPRPLGDARLQSYIGNLSELAYNGGEDWTE